MSFPWNKITFRERDGRVVISGFEHGVIRVAFSTGSYLVLSQQGYSYWAGIGLHGWAPAEWFLVRTEPGDGGSAWRRAEVLDSEIARRGAARRIKARLMARAIELDQSEGA